MNKKIILDHGYVELVECWGSDERIIEAARMSTNKGFLGWGNKLKPGDEKLLKFLYDNRHHTPFEMAGMMIIVQAPIFVFREWHRHRTQSFNELSARYIKMPDENYMPTLERLMMNSKTNKQAGVADGALELTEGAANAWLRLLQDTYQQAEFTYQEGLKIGVPKEVARCPVPVARYSRMMVSVNLRNWLGFLTLRMDPAAQWEIRQYANAVGELIEQNFPRTWELYQLERGRKEAWSNWRIRVRTFLDKIVGDGEYYADEAKLLLEEVA